MRILKFGGSSVKDVEAIERTCSIILDRRQTSDICVVFSAFGKTTDLLLHAARAAEQGKEEYGQQLQLIRNQHLEILEYFLTGEDQKLCSQYVTDNFEVLGELLHSVYLSRELSDRFKDLILSYGERNSNHILSFVLRQKGLDCSYLDARKIIKTDNRFGGARVLIEPSYSNTTEHFSTHSSTQIVTGYISSTVDEITTTLGRGGSDYTASLLGAALNADCIEIWTDVNGVMSAHPLLVPEARSIAHLSYMEARELSYFGAKVIFPPTISPAQRKNIPIYIKNSSNKDHPGTKISSFQGDHGKMDISGITSIPGLCICTLDGGLDYPAHALAAIMFSAIENEDISVYLITQGSSESSISFAVNDHVSDKIKILIDRAFKDKLPSSSPVELVIENKMCAIAIVGEKILLKPGITGKAFQVLGEKGINIEAIAQGSSERTISFLVKEKDQSVAVQSLHQEFFP